ncbi:hypothetical protein BN8_01038 [Fibrisoma limi BUZ 3]|uniref:Uncharacterized protein n=1 Tax=Fibrisoma limi BUZ 3 TaxID=1185876 RepID=I2GDU1_9BACT|nr:hypothetical protein BN8_01038 [Fibrisoma limi BUZ 3]
MFGVDRPDRTTSRGKISRKFLFTRACSIRRTPTFDGVVEKQSEGD